MNKTIEYYNRNAKEFCDATLNADMSFCREKFSAYLPSRAEILDAGCGSGRDAHAFIEEGYNVTAMDASSEVCREAETLLGREVLCMTFEEMRFDSYFDGVWACASLLHVGRDSIDSAMEQVAKALKPGGVLYASFKYGTGEAVVKDRFFNYYDEQQLAELFFNHGFEIKEIFVTEDVRENRPDEKWVNGIGRKGWKNKESKENFD